MPSGGRKKKAVKKKGKNGDAHNNSNNSSFNSSSTHSQGSEDPRSLDDRESDSGEVEREEEEKEEAKEEVEAVDYEEGGGKIGKGLSEEIAEIKKEAIYENSDSLGVDFGGADVAKETPISILISEDSVPSNGAGVQDKVVVEEEKSMTAVWEELKALDGSFVSETKPVDDTPKQEAISVEGASVKLAEDVVSLSQDKTVADFGSSMSSGFTESGSIKNAGLALQISDVKEEFSSKSEGPQSVKAESEIVYKDEEKSSAAPPVDLSSKYEDFKTLETDKQLKEQSAAPAVDLSTKLDDFKTLETGKQVEEQLVAPAVDLGTKLDDFKTLETGKQLEEQLVAPAVTTKPVVESVKNKETVEQSDNKAGLTEANTSSEVDNVKEIETQTRSIDQTSIGHNPLPVRRTSWLGCCGLFEAFSGANR